MIQDSKNRPLAMLGCGYEGEHEMAVLEMPIYPEVREALGIKYGGQEELIRTKNHYTSLTPKMDMEEWLHQYIYRNDLCKMV